jgi:PAS domain S-box-containing protein
VSTPQANPKRPSRSTDLSRLLDAAPRAGSGETSDIAKWQETVEELSVAQEELQQQNEELINASGALDAERQRYHEMFNFAPDCYLLTDPFGIVREANLAAAGLFHHAPPRLAGRPLRLYLHPDRRADFDLLMVKLRSGQPVRGTETVVQPPGGLAVPVSVHASPELDADGQMAGLRWLLHDLTPLKEAQARAVEAERLAAVGQTVAALAHESRNALQRSQACLRMLALEAGDNPKALEYIERVQKAQDDLARLFEDVRTFTAAPVLDRRRCDLRQVWRDAWRDLHADRPGCTLVEDVKTDDLTCVADAFRLGQVFRNLFDNAVAAAPDPARIVVRAAAAALNGRRALRVTVEDNGPGVPPDVREKLFDPFFSTKSGGMGLGLAITRRVVEAHGGRIIAGDGEAGGAAFVMTIPGGGKEVEE